MATDMEKTRLDLILVHLRQKNPAATCEDAAEYQRTHRYCDVSEFDQRECAGGKYLSEDYVMRYCASEQSLPDKAEHVFNLWGKTRTQHNVLFNDYTGLPFGFSYWILKKCDPCPIYRVIERDILDGYKKIRTLDTYERFVDHYYDESFEPVYGTEHDCYYVHTDEKIYEYIDPNYDESFDEY
jgi:hypothetical protein